MSNTDSPARMEPSQAKRKSTELGQSNATHFELELYGFCETTELICAALAIEPYFKSSKAR
jgi:hypothetical protein